MWLCGAQSVIKCCLHIIFLNLLRSALDIKLDSNVDK